MENIVEMGISLSDTIRAIQDELIKSQKRRKDQNQPPLFKTDRLVLEANCIITKNKAAEGGIEFKLIPGLQVGTKADYVNEKSMVHKITIEFKTVSSENDTANQTNKVNEPTATKRKIFGPDNGELPHPPVIKSSKR